MATIASLNPVAASGVEEYPLVQGGVDKSRQNNFTATTAPSVTDDSAAGYSVGSFWYNATRGILYIARSVSAGAAVWRRVRRGHIGYVVGNWYVGEAVGPVAASGSATIVGNLWAHPFFVPEPITISDLAFKTAATVSGSTELAIYAATAAGGRPSLRLGYTNPIANAAASTVYSGALVGGALALEPGWYWGVSQGDAASTYVAINASNNVVISSAIGSATLANALTASSAITGLQMANTYNTDPTVTFPSDLSSATWNDHTANRNPVIAFKVSALP
ncbi:hypothetical protein [Methylorubrum suomiense]|uniref:Minor tail protein n=1 Tax=Methylorubrum suomiense TaxID=144191 RepID=A0ABQ4UYK6_9HYPH|nr:hypothetical protein [Methylorubrum suomiense]GJE77271.1 hypothetical protein BGCPKDLD_3874 [Methylorubrum suomiense]